MASSFTEEYYNENNVARKTPVSLLNELCAKQGYHLPDYELLSSEGEVGLFKLFLKLHNRPITCLCFLSSTCN